MLMTVTQWADPTRAPLTESHQAWKYVAWTCGTVSFWVIRSDDDAPDVPDVSDAPDGWLVAGPEALHEAAGEFEPGAIAVYVLDRVGTQSARLSRVTGLWREVGAPHDASCFWYANDSGELKPCTPSPRPPRSRLELAVSLVPEPPPRAACA
ncbi:hypothetical protein [Paraburkholderia sp. MM5384-R2]|uniref:hypothetical protein n=1 Tax=Paraburkholderia sp. MM5384-R2 TaxID=2723097 RepID=UPI00161A69A6|nr:hypothetical protein [Paraburkholderia sp. MM5384-R2]MBB5502192.1 hypothetical protein [Paraburkholderia sp. MM5384-R2]